MVPTIGTVIEDLSTEIMRSYGKIAGYDSYDHGKISNFQVGSYATELKRSRSKKETTTWRIYYARD